MKAAGRIRILGAGDVAFQTAPTPRLGERLSRYRLDLERRTSVLFYGNLELPLTSRGRPADKPVPFRGPPEGAAALRAMGFDVLTLANNHALDYGAEGLEDTMQALASHHLSFVGAGMGVEALRADIRNVGGTQVAFIAFCSTVPRGYAAGEGRLGVAPLRAHQAIYVDGALFDEQPGTAPYVQTWPHEDDLIRAEQAIGELRRLGVDVIVVAVHWGVPPMWMAPYQGALADYQRPMAKRLITAGADVIFGHHPHVPQHWEWLEERPVFYSLGNFLFQPYTIEHPQDGPATPNLLQAPRSPETKEGLLAEIELDGATICRLEIKTFLLDDAGEPISSAGERHEAMAERLRAASNQEGPAPVVWAPFDALD